MTSRRPDADAAIVGGGLAGLACAHDLARAGHSVVILEAGASAGGRARTQDVGATRVDVGFQALFRAYPETRRLCDEVGLGGGELRRFARTLVVNDGTATRVLTADPRSVLGLPGVGTRHVAAFARVAARAVRTPPDRLLAEGPGEPTTEAYLRASGVGDGLIDGVVRPFFGVVFLDRSLAADPGYFLYLLGMMLRGPVVLPAGGLGEIGERTASAAAAHGADLRTGARVAAVEAGEAGGFVLRLIDETRVTARQVVLAAEAPATRRLLEPLDPASAARLPAEAASVMTAAFLLDVPLYRGATIILNSSDDPDPRVDLLCHTTNVTHPGGAGPHVLLATCVTTGHAATPDADAFTQAVARQVHRLNPGFPWTRVAHPLGVTRHPFAQFRPLAGVRADLPGPATAVPGLTLAGDGTQHPSIEGAVTSGRRAAAVVSAALRGA